MNRTHKAIWDWYQEIGSDTEFHKLFRLGRERVKIFAVDETGITIAGMQAFLYMAYEPFQDRILGLHLAWNPNSISAELFLRDLRLCKNLVFAHSIPRRSDSFWPK